MKWLALFLLCFSPNLHAQEKVLWVPMKGTVELGLSPYIARAVQYAESQKFDALVLDIDTFGGRVDAAVVIRDALLNSKLQTVAWVNKRAISAGALISLACKKIYYTSGSTMGAATPIQMGTDGGAQPVENKIVSYFRAEMGATAEKNGRNRKLAEAMVKATEDISDLVKKDDVLTLTDVTALKSKMSDGTMNSKEEVLAALGFKNPQVEEFKINWAEKIVRFLTDPTVSSLLMTGGILGLIMEFQAPGFGLPGIVGIVCLGTFFFGKFLVHLAGWEEVLLLLLGLALLFIEIFLMPGKIIPGAIGGVLVIVSLVMAGISPKMPVDFSFPDIRSHLMNVGLSMAGVIFGIIGISFFLSRNPRLSPLVMSESLEHGGGLSSAENLSFLNNETGIATTDLRPSGKCHFDKGIYEVLTQGDYIKKGSRVRVVQVEGSKVTVEAIQNS